MNTKWDEIQNALSLSTVKQALFDWVPALLMAVFILLASWVLWRVIRRGISVLVRRMGKDSTLESLMHSAVKLVIFSIAIVSALGQVGVDIAGLLTGLGVLGLTIGFAAKDTLSNLISGFFILWDRPFTINDLVEIGGTYGRVERITLRTTRVVTVDGKMLAIPNTEVVNKIVASYTNFPHLRLDVAFTVALTEDLGKVRMVALSVCQDDDRLLTDPPPEVVVTALNDYNVAMELRVWLDDERTHIPVRFQLRGKLFEALRSAGVEMPYETFSLTPVEVRSVVAESGGK